MNKYFTKVSFTLLGVLLAGLLSSCGESNNLADPTAIAPSRCTDLLGVVCVTGRFIDDAVSNLDYECETVVAKTEVDGSFSCPINSSVTFYIKNPDDLSDTAKKITLGSVIVKSPANLGPNVTSFFYVTPFSLFQNDMTSRRNMVRLMQALSDDPVSPDLTGHIIVISDSDKKKLTLLANEIVPSDFSKPRGSPALNTTFDYLLANFLGALTPNKSIVMENIDNAEADTYLYRGFHSTVAGVYTSPLGIFGSIGSPEGAAAMTGTNTAANKSMIATIWSVVDRKGRVMGAGTYSYEPSGGTQLLSTNPKAMEMTEFGTTPLSLPAPLWKDDNQHAGMTFSLMDPNNVLTTKKLQITQGKMDRDGLAGTDAQYKTLFDEPKAPTGALGRWKLSDGNATEIDPATTQFTLVRTSPAAPALNPDLWVGGGITFPLHAKLTFYNSDPSMSPGPGCDLSGCPIGEPIAITILQDGNVISDINADCAAVDPNTLKQISDPSKQELPLGLVQRIFKSSSSDSPANKTFMTLAIILPNKPLVLSSTPGDAHDKYLHYAQLMTNFGVAVVMQVETGDPDYLKLHSVTSALQPDQSTKYTYNSLTANWANYLTFLKNISTPTVELGKNSAGYVRSAPAVCPP